MSKIALFLAIVLVIVGAIYGVSQSFEGSFKMGDVLSYVPWFSSGTRVSTSTLGSPVRVTTQETQKKYPVGKATTTIQKTQEPKPPTPPEGFTVRDLSPFFGKVQITSVTRPSYSVSRRGQLTLRANALGDMSLDITGWKIKGNVGGEIYIPQASGEYTLSGWESSRNIVLSSGNYVVIYSTKSGVDRNIRLNKCIGYLNNLYTFSPRLPNTCPARDTKQVSLFSGACQTYLRSLRTCEEPTANEKNQFGGSGDASCRAFLDTLNYGGCYKAHRNDRDFFSNEWRVWLNAEMPFDTQHDRLVLYDKNGKVVDDYTY